MPWQPRLLCFTWPQDTTNGAAQSYPSGMHYGSKSQLFDFGQHSPRFEHWEFRLTTHARRGGIKEGCSCLFWDVRLDTFIYEIWGLVKISFEIWDHLIIILIIIEMWDWPLFILEISDWANFIFEIWDSNKSIFEIWDGFIIWYECWDWDWVLISWDKTKANYIWDWGQVCTPS